MAAEEDNFDIDIYGDGGEDYQDDGQAIDLDQQDGNEEVARAFDQKTSSHEAGNGDTQAMNTNDGGNDEAILSADHQQSNATAFQANQTQQLQNLKRKEGPEDGPVDPGATAALFVSDLHWWITDDDVRGWTNQSGREDELREITFHEHKVNGKSKGQAYIAFTSPQAATAVKHKIDALVEAQVYKQKFTVSFANPSSNPFKTLPKDGNARNNVQGTRTSSGSFNSSNTGGPSHGAYNSGNYRGRGTYNNNNRGGFNRGGFSQPQPGSWQQGGGMGGFQNPAMGGMQSYTNNFGNRGGMLGGGMRGGSMNMRGGRGGMNQGNMMGGYMGAMNMGGMPNMGMGMPQMNGGMGMQGFGLGFPQQGAVDSSWNPHGAKRTRQE